MKKLTVAIAFVALTALLGGCGIKGPLYMPTEDNSSALTQSLM